MPKQYLTSLSGKFIYYPRFDDLCRIAAGLKAHIFFADAVTNKMYAFYEECYSVIETDIPFKLDNSIFFTSVVLGTTYRQKIFDTKCYFTVPECPWFAFPENRRGDFMNGYIAYDYETESFVDPMTNCPIDDCILIGIPLMQFTYDKYIKFLSALNFRYSHRSMNPIVFQNAEENPTIQAVSAGKVTEGTKNLILSKPENGKKYLIKVFKNLIGPMAKADKLNIHIQDDNFESDKFIVCFEVLKKRCNWDVPEIKGKPVTIRTYALILNLL